MGERARQAAEEVSTQVHPTLEALQIKVSGGGVAHLNGVQVVAGSNPAGPTRSINVSERPRTVSKSTCPGAQVR
jgi:hypothetical protein